MNIYLKEDRIRLRRSKWQRLLKMNLSTSVLINQTQPPPNLLHNSMKLFNSFCPFLLQTLINILSENEVKQTAYFTCKSGNVPRTSCMTTDQWNNPSIKRVTFYTVDMCHELVLCRNNELFCFKWKLYKLYLKKLDVFLLYHPHI